MFEFGARPLAFLRSLGLLLDDYLLDLAKTLTLISRTRCPVIGRRCNTSISRRPVEQTACGYAGVVNTVLHAREVTDLKTIDALTERMPQEIIYSSAGARYEFTAG